jgi:voltage-gated potassium channel
MRGSAEALERFERQTALPMFLLALLSLPILVAPFIWTLSPTVETSLFAIDWFIWAVFAVEYGIRLYLAPDKKAFAKRNIVDVVVVVLPFLRPLRLVRSVRFLRLLRLGRLTVYGARAVDALRDLFKHKRLNYTLLVAIITWIGTAMVVLELERSSPDSNIRTLPDALWWAVTTITTVGYGDRYPTTAPGRAIGACVMIVGIALFGLLAATISSIFVRKDVSQEVDEQFDELVTRLERIETALDRLHRSERIGTSTPLHRNGSEGEVPAAEPDRSQ